ncbi:MAG: class I SAM-dependent methyltransferase [Desulfurococcaceae archaeon]
MCNVAVIEFFIENVRPEEFKDKRILEVGSKYVDVVLPAEELVEYFGSESFDVVISTETLEHVKDWRKVITNMREVLKPGGYIYITTRSRGFSYHGYPYDFWRYEVGDMRRIFADFEIINLSVDHEAPGVFVKARKPL